MCKPKLPYFPRDTARTQKAERDMGTGGISCGCCVRRYGE